MVIVQIILDLCNKWCTKPPNIWLVYLENILYNNDAKVKYVLDMTLKYNQLRNTEEYRITCLLPLLPVPLCPRMVVSVKVSSMNQMFGMMFKMILNYIDSLKH